MLSACGCDACTPVSLPRAALCPSELPVHPSCCLTRRLRNQSWFPWSQHNCTSNKQPGGRSLLAWLSSVDVPLIYNCKLIQTKRVVLRTTICLKTLESMLKRWQRFAESGGSSGLAQQTKSGTWTTDCPGYPPPYPTHCTSPRGIAPCPVPMLQATLATGKKVVISNLCSLISAWNAKMM